MQGATVVKTMKLWDGQAIAPNENVVSPAIDLRQIINNHKFSLHAIIAGDGQLDISVEYCSTKDGTYIADSNLIADNQVVGSIFVSFDPVIAPFIRIRATENNTGAITSLTAWLNIG